LALFLFSLSRFLTLSLFPLISLTPSISLVDFLELHFFSSSHLSLSLSQVFLHNLAQLLLLDNFKDLWLRLLDYLDKYMHIEGSEMLAEAVLESLKNMLLVMSTGGIFRPPPPPSVADPYPSEATLPPPCALWNLTWARINMFQPRLHDELFPPEQKANDILLAQHIQQQKRRTPSGSDVSVSVSDPSLALNPPLSPPQPAAHSSLQSFLESSPMQLLSPMPSSHPHPVQQFSPMPQMPNLSPQAAMSPYMLPGALTLGVPLQFAPSSALDGPPLFLSALSSPANGGVASLNSSFTGSTMTFASATTTTTTTALSSTMTSSSPSSSSA
jgi:hypothetical protein